MKICSSTTQNNARHDGAALGWRFAAISRAKGDSEASLNDDAWIFRETSSHLELAVIDVATHKRGVLGSEIQSVILDTFSAASVHCGPVQIIAAAHLRLFKLLRDRGARGVACLLILRLMKDGSAEWAHVGDAVLLRWQCPNWWRRSSLQQVNTRHRQGHGLTQCVGSQQQAGPVIQEGNFLAAPGEHVLLASDGVFHDEMSLSSICRWVDAYDQQHDVLLPRNLATKIEAEARMTQPDPDDTAIIVVERVSEGQP